MTKSRSVTITKTKKNRASNRFLAVRKQTSTDGIIFPIVDLIDKSNKYENTYFKVGDELREFNNVSIQPEQRIRRVSESSPDRGANARRQQQQQQQQQRPDRQQNNSRRQVSKKPYDQAHKVKKFSFKYFLCWDHQGRLLQQKLCFRCLFFDNKEPKSIFSEMKAKRPK